MKDRTANTLIVIGTILAIAAWSMLIVLITQGITEYSVKVAAQFVLGFLGYYPIRLTAAHMWRTKY